MTQFIIIILFLAALAYLGNKVFQSFRKEDCGCSVTHCNKPKELLK